MITLVWWHCPKLFYQEVSVLASKRNARYTGESRLQPQTSSEPSQKGAEESQNEARRTQRGRIMCREPAANKQGLDSGFVQADR